MTNKYLKPMLDPGSPRVFNCCVVTQKLLKQDPEAPLFFRNRRLNTILLIKDTIPEADRSPSMPSVGTKLYFPFNENNIYEGGRTIFLHEKGVKKNILAHYGESALDNVLLEEDMKIMELLGSLPSLDPFLMKDIFLRHKFPVNDAYFEVSDEAWREIELFMLQRFELLVRAAFPSVETTDEKARLLIDKIWEARDMEALRPLIMAFRLPEAEALDVFASWRGIVYYSYQYHTGQAKFVEMMKWLKETDHPYTGVPSQESKEVQGFLSSTREALRAEWQTTETITREYEDSYNKMFREKTESASFLNFLKNSRETYWTLGNSLGKVSHAVYCWDVTTARYENRALPWTHLGAAAKLLASIFKPEKAAASATAWT